MENTIEEEVTLQTSRLKMLLAASECLVDQEYENAKTWLLNYKATVDGNTEVGQILDKKYNELDFIYKKTVRENDELITYVVQHSGQNRIMDAVNYHPYKWQRERNEEVLEKFIRDLYKVCWELGHSWNLLPKK